MPTKEQLRLVEASLFIAGRPINEIDLIQLTEVKNKDDLSIIIEQLSKNLEERNSFIEIVKMQDQYLMRVRRETKKELGELETRKSVSDEYMKLLAIIAMKQPLKTSEIRKIYRVKELKETLSELERKGFIQITTEQRVKYVSTTPHFATVFNLDPNNLKSSIVKMVTHRLAQQAVKPPEFKREKKSKKEIYSPAEKRKIEARYKELMERLTIEREEERIRLEEEAMRKAEEEILMEKLKTDPMAELLKKDKDELEVKNELAVEEVQDVVDEKKVESEEKDVADEEIEQMLDDLEDEEDSE